MCMAGHECTCTAPCLLLYNTFSLKTHHPATHVPGYSLRTDLCMVRSHYALLQVKGVCFLQAERTISCGRCY